MFGHQIGFDRPWYLLLLLVLPILWWASFRTLSGLGPWRRWFALGLRSFVLTLLVLALAEVQLVKVSDKVTVIYALDQSDSIPASKRRAMLDFVVEDVKKHRNAPRGDKAGVVVFGREASIEVPPFDDDIHTSGVVESYLGRTDATNLAAAFKLAQASFPEDSAKRIVVVSDGNENVGDVRAVAPSLAEQGVGVDAVAVKLSTRGEVAVERIALPNDIRRGQPIEARIVVNNIVSGAGEAAPVKGKLRLVRRGGQTVELLAEQEVELDPGKNVFPFKHAIVNPDVYTYEADFVPTDPRDDLMNENNKVSAFTHVRGRGRVLFIEDWKQKGEHDDLVSRLRAAEIEVTMMSSDNLFTSLAELQGFDSVVLANVARASGDEAAIANFSDDQIDMLVRNTQQMGCGLLMLGGPNSFGAGGWTNTSLEKAMPVDFQIKNEKIRAVGALVLMMHASEMAQGNFWQKQVAHLAINALGPLDYCGLIHYGTGGDSWLWGGRNGLVRVGENKKKMLNQVDTMTPGDMPQFEGSMGMALAGFNRVNASVKLMVVISDGDPSPPQPGTLNRFKQGNIQITTVAIGAHGPAEHATLQRIANATGGKYYKVNNPKALPQIYQAEVKKVSKSLIYENQDGIRPQLKYPHEMLQGLDGPPPPITGFVMTTVKENPLVEVAWQSPQPSAENGALLASWTYGLGRTAVLTTDVGQRWAASWKQWPQYDQFFTQLVRWSMRPVDERGKFTVATDIKDGKVRVVVTALDKDDEFLNFLNMSASGVSPSLDAFDVKIDQAAPGRYVGEFDADKPGSYFVTIHTGSGGAPIIAGVTVPYSDEYKVRSTNRALLEQLTSFSPKGGDKGRLFEADVLRDELATLVAQNDPFRQDLPKARSSQDVWPLVVLAASCLFFGDVFVRRVMVSWEWLWVLMAWLRKQLFGARPEDVVREERLERLRHRKAAVGGQLDERRAALRFEPQPDATPPIAAEKSLDDVLRDASAPTAASAPPPPPSATSSGPTPEADSYTSRLLKAKEQAKKPR